MALYSMFTVYFPQQANVTIPGPRASDPPHRLGLVMDYVRPDAAFCSRMFLDISMHDQMQGKNWMDCWIFMLPGILGNYSQLERTLIFNTASSFLIIPPHLLVVSTQSHDLRTCSMQKG